MLALCPAPIIAECPQANYVNSLGSVLHIRNNGGNNYLIAWLLGLNIELI